MQYDKYIPDLHHLSNPVLFFRNSARMGLMFVCVRSSKSSSFQTESFHLGLIDIDPFPVQLTVLIGFFAKT